MKLQSTIHEAQVSSPVEGDAGADLNWQRSEGDPCPRCRLPALRFFEIEGDEEAPRVCGECIKRARSFHEGMKARREFLLGRIEAGTRDS